MAQQHPAEIAKQLDAGGEALPIATLYHVGVPIMATYDPSVDIQVGQWSMGLCSCCDSCVPNCCMASWLPCISLAQIAHRIGVASYTTVLLVFGVLYLVEIIMGVLVVVAMRDYLSRDDYDYYSNRYDEPSFAVGVPHYLASLAAFAMFIGTWQLRTKIRARFHVPGGCCEDCVVSYCCGCCALAQMATHVKSYKAGSCDFGPPDVLPAYQ